MKATIVYNDGSHYTYGNVVRYDNESVPGVTYIIQEIYPTDNIVQTVETSITMDDSIMYIVVRDGNEQTIIGGTVTSFTITPNAEQVQKQKNILENQKMEQNRIERDRERGYAMLKARRKAQYLKTIDSMEQTEK